MQRSSLRALRFFAGRGNPEERCNVPWIATPHKEREARNDKQLAINTV